MTRAQQLILALGTLSSAVAVAEVAKAPAVQPVAKPTPPGPSAGAPANPLPNLDMEVVARRRPPPPPPQPAKPPAEIATLGKLLAGTWQCKGNTQRGDGSSAPIVSTVTVKLDLEDAWIQMTLAEVASHTTKFTEYRTYDATAKQWTRIQMNNTTGHLISTSLGEKDGKWTWAGELVAPNGTLQLHDYEQLGAKEVKLWGEALLGGTWQKTYEVSCKK
jgi:hypothetical protein